MEILNYQEQPVGAKAVAIFDVYIPALQVTFHKFRLVRAKNGNTFISGPSYGEDQGDGSKKWFPYVSFSEEKGKEFNRKCFELLKPFQAKSA